MIQIGSAAAAMCSGMSRRSAIQGMSHAHLYLNRNRRCVVIDAKSAAGRQNLKALLETADVFISNMRAPAMRKLQRFVRNQFTRWGKLVRDAWIVPQ